MMLGDCDPYIDVLMGDTIVPVPNKPKTPVSTSEKTPTTDEIREGFKASIFLDEDDSTDEKGWQVAERRGLAFDSWLAARDTAARAGEHEAFAGANDTDPDGSDQSVTSGEVTDRSPHPQGANGWDGVVTKQERDALATLCAAMMTPAIIPNGYVNQDFNALADAILAAGYRN